MTSPVSQRLLLFAAGLTAAGCVKRLPPAPVPEAIAPPISAAAPAEGVGRLVVDVVEGPTPVQRVQMGSQEIRDAQGRASFRLFESPHLMCPASPCITDLAPGNVLLGFPVIGDPDALEVELVHVGPEPSVYRRSLSVYTDDRRGTRRLGIIGTSVGGASLVTGIVLLPIGLGDDSDGLTTAGAITMGAGAVVMTLGILAIRRGRATYRAGSSNHFSF